MVKSGLKRGLAVLFLAGGLFAASGVFPGVAYSFPVPTYDDGLLHPAEVHVASHDESGTTVDPDNASQKNDTSQANAANGRTMIASYYGRSFEGRLTASGEPFDADAYTAANRSLPLGTKLRVSYGGESVVVTVNDRGPYVAGRDLDLSLAAARKIGLTGSGTGAVRVVVLS